MVTETSTHLQKIATETRRAGASTPEKGGDAHGDHRADHRSAHRAPLVDVAERAPSSAPKARGRGRPPSPERRGPGASTPGPAGDGDHRADHDQSYAMTATDSNDRDDLLRRLAEIRHEVELAQRAFEDATDRRSALIVEATAAGLTRDKVGRALGLTRARVQQILTKAGTRP